MNAPPFPTNPAIGDTFGNWAWNGVRWVATGGTGVVVKMQVFNAGAGTYSYQPSPGLVSAIIELQGAGGGGGGATSDVPSTSETGWIMGGGGGASGGYSRSALPAALLAGGVVVTLGAGGAPGLNGTSGGQGAPSSFGAYLLANGGNGGTLGDAGTHFGTGGDRAAPGIGQMSTQGNGGTAAVCLYWDGGFSGGVASGGQGGVGFFGGAGVAEAANLGGGSNGYNGFAGSGGCGAVSGISTFVGSGGQGGDAVCVVTEFCWGDAIPPDCLNPPLRVDARVALTNEPWPGPGPCPPGWGQLDYDG